MQTKSRIRRTAVVILVPHRTVQLIQLIYTIFIVALLAQRYKHFVGVVGDGQKKMAARLVGNIILFTVIERGNDFVIVPLFSKRLR